MSKRNSNFLTILLWSIILVIAVGAFLFFMSGGRLGMKNLESYDTSKYEIAKEDNFSNINRLEVDYTNAELIIKGYDGQDVKVIEKRGENYKEDTLFTSDVSGDKLKLKDGRIKKWGIFNWNLGWDNIPLIEIYLPKNVYDEINLDTAKGNIAVENVKMKELDIDMASGDLLIQNVKIDIAKFDMASGDIDAKNIKAEKFGINVMSADVNIEGSIKKFDYDGGSGDLILNSTTMIDKLDIDIASGDSEIVIPENKGFIVKLDKISGNFNSDFTLKQNDDTYIYKDGSAEYKIDMVSGNVFLGVNKSR